MQRGGRRLCASESRVDCSLSNKRRPLWRRGRGRRHPLPVAGLQIGLLGAPAACERSFCCQAASFEPVLAVSRQSKLGEASC